MVNIYISWDIWKVYFLDTYVIYYLLQFTYPVIGAEYAALRNVYITQADIKRSTLFPAPAGETGVRVLGKH